MKDGGKRGPWAARSCWWLEIRRTVLYRRRQRISGFSAAPMPDLKWSMQHMARRKRCSHEIGGRLLERQRAVAVGSVDGDLIGHDRH